MLQIDCPWCGVRDEEEFCCGGQSHIIRPPQPENISDAEWADYLFNRINPKGVHLERWRHTFGCRQWFNIARHTVSHEILAIYKMGEAPPDLPSISLPESGNPVSNVDVNKPTVAITEMKSNVHGTKHSVERTEKLVT